ncbi:MAG: tryptophan halogenase family protein [Pseudomonadota bacterium]
MYKNLVIVGGGTAGWIAASMLSRPWNGPAPNVTLVESPNIERVGVGESSIPSLRRLISTLRIDEKDFMQRCQATYKCSLHLVDWRRETGSKSGRTDYYHPLFRWGEDQPEWFREWLHARAHEDHEEDFDFSCFAGAHLANERRSPKTAIGDDHSTTLQYAYHLDAALFAEYLAEWSTARGVTRVLANVTNVGMTESGDISHVSTDTAGDLHGDLFIDCTGFRGLLINGALNVPFESYQDTLFCDAAVAISTFKPEPLHEIPCETRATAMDAGWIWDIPLRHRHGCGYVYSSRHLSTDEAEAELRRHLNGLEQSDARHIRMRVGRNQHIWKRNCVSVGLSAGFVEPLESTSIFCIQNGVAELLRVLREDTPMDRRRDKYNHLMGDLIDGIRDFVAAHYYLSDRNDTDFWRANRADERLPDSLVEILDAWRAGDDIDSLLQAHGSSRVVSPASWYCVFAGSGVLPNRVARRSETTLTKVVQRGREARSLARDAADHGRVLAAV